MVFLEMRSRGGLVLMAVEAVDRIQGRMAKIFDDVLHLGKDPGIFGVDSPGGVVAGGADIAMGHKDVWPVQDIVTIRAGSGINLTQITGDKGDLVIDAAAAGAVVMAGEIGSMAGDALTGAAQSRTLTGAIGSVVAGGAAAGGMGLAGADEGRSGGGVAA